MHTEHEYLMGLNALNNQLTIGVADEYIEGDKRIVLNDIANTESALTPESAVFSIECWEQLTIEAKKAIAFIVFKSDSIPGAFTPTGRMSKHLPEVVKKYITKTFGANVVREVKNFVQSGAKLPSAVELKLHTNKLYS